VPGKEYILMKFVIKRGAWEILFPSAAPKIAAAAGCFSHLEKKYY